MGLLDDEELLRRPAFGVFPQMQPRRRFQDPVGAANVPLDVTRGRLAGLLGLLPDALNFMGRSPMPTEMFGDTQYEPTPQMPYGSEYYLQNLPLKPTARIGEVAGQAGAFVPLNPMPAARAVAAGARALGPTAVGMGEGYLKRRGLMPELDVYHGSPHKFDRFDASKIGTGEGAQAYGYGIYTAENPGVAMQYRDALAIDPRDSVNSVRAAFNPVGGGTRWNTPKLDDIYFEMKRHPSLEPYLNDSSFKKDILKIIEGTNPDGTVTDEAINVLRRLDKSMPKPSGQFYKVDLPDEQIAKMLDYDKPISEQSDEVKNILLPYQKEIGGSFGTGEQTLKAIAFERRMKGLDDSPTAVSQQLRDMGIPGIKYLDATSRGAGTGTRNFVTFPGEEQSMTILERNGQPMIARPQQQDAAPDLLQYQQMLDEEERKKLGGLLFR